MEDFWLEDSRQDGHCDGTARTRAHDTALHRACGGAAQRNAQHTRLVWQHLHRQPRVCAMCPDFDGISSEAMQLQLHSILRVSTLQIAEEEGGRCCGELRHK